MKYEFDCHWCDEPVEINLGWYEHEDVECPVCGAEHKVKSEVEVEMENRGREEDE